MGVSKPQGEQCSILTMYYVISKGSSVGIDPTTGTATGTRSLTGNWSPWMTTKIPKYIGRDIVGALTNPQVLGQGVYKQNPDWVNTWINQAIAIADYVGYTPYTGIGNARGQEGWLYGWWDGGKNFAGIPSQRTSTSLQCIWKTMQDDPDIKKVLGQKDSWNPVDTYMVKENVDKKIHTYCENLLEEFNKGNVAAENFVGTVNIFLSKLVKDKTLVPISLKKQTTGVSMRIKSNNIEDMPSGVIDVVTGGFTDDPYSYFQIEDRSGKLDFKGNSFLYKAQFQVGAYRQKYKIEQRMQQSNNKQEVKDIVKKDAGGYKDAGAQAGNVPVNDFKDLIKTYANVSSYDFKVPSRTETLKDISYWVDLYDTFTKYKFKDKSVDLGATEILGTKFSTQEYFTIAAEMDAQKDDKSLNAFIVGLFPAFTKKKLKKERFSGKFRNKLYNLRFLQALKNANDKDDLCMLLTSIYYGAAKMKMKATDLQGPFLKLS